MSSNSLASYLCAIHHHHEPEKILYSAHADRVSAFVIALLGISLIGAGLYLLFGSVGTIPALTSGAGLLISGAAALIFSVFSVLKSS